MINSADVASRSSSKVSAYLVSGLLKGAVLVVSFACSGERELPSLSVSGKANLFLRIFALFCQKGCFFLHFRVYYP